jgi:hypothetical protein
MMALAELHHAVRICHAIKSTPGMGGEIMNRFGTMGILCAGAIVAALAAPPAHADGPALRAVCIIGYGFQVAGCASAATALEVDPLAGEPLCVGGYGHAAIACGQPEVRRIAAAGQGEATCVSGYGAVAACPEL